MAKRLFDILLSLILLILFLPVMAILFILIKIDSEGPGFYQGLRVGLGSKPFRMMKFRTMIPDADKVGGPSTSDDDPRLTGYGKFLRRYKLDELPQLINVLNGEMSFVGPRPEVPSEVARYTEEERKLLTVRPGITDYASFTYHNEGKILEGAEDPHEAYRRLIRPGKIKLGLRYVREQSFGTDVKILTMTLMTLMGSRLKLGGGEEDKEGKKA
jgi:lipopolysaccharide/colanic/teichoic acid biosynthesis glycosyltransferase